MMMTTAIEPIRRNVHIGTWVDASTERRHNVFLQVYCGPDVLNKKDHTIVSVTGIEGPRPNGDAYGSCGVIACDGVRDGWELRTDVPWIPRLLDTAKRYHLNNMHAECEHQRERWNLDERVEVVEYGLTTEAQSLRNTATVAAAKAAARGESPTMSDTARALVLLDDWFKARFTPPDADSPLSGCFEVKKRETKSVRWVKESEHPRGVLSKACEVCGYKYGSAWRYEAVPDEVVDFLRSLPDDSELMPTCWRRPIH